MKRLFVLLFCGFTLISCSKDPEITANIELNGVYEGSFNRYGSHKTSEVSLDFFSTGVTGSSDVRYYPAICRADFTMNSKTITFMNACNWPANFDWSLILNGEWRYTLNGDQLVLSRSNGDKYDLKKVK